MKLDFGASHDFCKMMDRRMRLYNTLLSIASLFAYAFFLLMTWKWFITPLGLPEIGYVQAIGIRGMIGLLLPVPDAENETEKLGDAIVSLIMKSAAFGLLFVVSLFI